MKPYEVGSLVKVRGFDYEFVVTSSKFENDNSKGIGYINQDCDGDSRENQILSLLHLYKDEKNELKELSLYGIGSNACYLY